MAWRKVHVVEAILKTEGCLSRERPYVTTSAVTIPNMPLADSAWGRMWQ
jgi:hypothetical protein